MGRSEYFHSEFFFTHCVLFVGKGKCLWQPDKVPASRTCSYAVCVSNCCPAEKSCVMDYPQSELKDSCQHCCLERRLICRYTKSHRFQPKFFFSMRKVFDVINANFNCIYILLFVHIHALCPLSFTWQIRQLFHYHQSSIIFMNLPCVRTGGGQEREPITEICSWQKIMLNVVFLFSSVHIKEGSNTRIDFRVVQLEIFRCRRSSFSSVCIISAGCRDVIAYANALKNIIDFKA